ncbi:MAG: acetoacetate--CoA ligase [Ilumatobacteraceae bacterium]|nr:acetoacetate--CoA ligase [Ilumatobacter sp.]MCO5328658.1 acetoacetate--CoA ligase [Ilumatobacteraceae bacterium]
MEPLWTPTPERIAASRMAAFCSSVAIDHPDVTDSVLLHDWSVTHPAGFWAEVWHSCGVIGDHDWVAFEPGDGTVLGGRFFPGAHVSYAENALVDRPGAGEEAIVAYTEAGDRRALTWPELRAEVAALAAALRAEGVQPGDRVAAYMPHVIETVVTFLAANAVGATFTSTSADFGTAGVVDRFGQTTPTVLVAADGYHYGGTAFDCLPRVAEVAGRLPSVRRTVVVGVLDSQPEVGGIPNAVRYTDYLAPHRGAPLQPLRLSGDHPVYILYSSGTTGKPKCITHRALGVLLMHLKEHQLHCDVRAGDRVLYFTTCGWMMWNWLVSGLCSGATIVLFDGSPFQPSPSALFDIAAAERVTLLGVSAKYIDSVDKTGLRPADAHDLAALRTVCSTGSPLSTDGFRWVYEAMKADVHLASISGGTDLCGCFVGGDPTRPVYEGEIQGPCLGMAVGVFDEDGRPVTEPGVKGELVCTAPFPSVPVGFWGDDTAATKFRAAYFDRFPGVWAHGDFASWTARGGMVIHGRSDATLNAGGVRIGTAEIYAQVEQVPGVVEAVAVGQEWDGDTRIVLFVKLAPGTELTDDLQAEIRRRLRANASPRHVPARIAAVTDVPRTRSNKISELAVADVVNGREVRNTEALANPEALAEYRDRPELAV